jgi:predicted transcriptional regulator
MQTAETTAPNWRNVLRYQGRSIGWLADNTGKSRRTVYAYSRGELEPSKEWLRRVSLVLGVEVAA